MQICTVAWTRSRLQGGDIVQNRRYLVGPESILRKGRRQVGPEHRYDKKGRHHMWPSIEKTRKVRHHM
jgi:hypothetical protein